MPNGASGILENGQDVVFTFKRLYNIDRWKKNSYCSFCNYYAVSLFSSPEKLQKWNLQFHIVPGNVHDPAAFFGVFEKSAALTFDQLYFNLKRT